MVGPTTPDTSSSPPAGKRGESAAATSDRLRHIGWRNVTTGKLWVVPVGHKPAEYDVGPEWEPIYVRA